MAPQVKPPNPDQPPDHPVRSLRNHLIDLADDLRLENEAALSLWSWLPSYQAVVDQHGEENIRALMPSIGDIMCEAVDAVRVLRSRLSSRGTPKPTCDVCGKATPGNFWGFCSPECFERLICNLDRLKG